MDQLIDLRRVVMEYITRFKERRINVLCVEAIKDLEDANEVRRKRAMDEENKRRVLEGIFVDLVRKIRLRRCPQMAQKIMIMLLEKHNKRQKMHEELLAKFKLRDNKMLKDTIKKLEEANKVRRKKAWIVNMDPLIDLRSCVMEYITRFKERRINALCVEAIKDLEDANEARRKRAMDIENKRRVLEGIFVDLVRKIRQRRCPQMAQKIMIMLIEKHSKRQKMHEELLAKFKVRDNKMLKDTIKKLEEANDFRRKEAWDQENRRRVLDNIFVDLVRKMRERRCPQMAKNIMTSMTNVGEFRSSS
uniref:Uncharacterized protein LOC111099137 n=1 Tax=Crassostrea virginica TaxID=6565 RepID=A0A8B8A8P7_CRAVI|nr:uncharacterized protein LOC111099137 [Crassostrea virginica]